MTALVSDVRAGMKLIADGGFTCLQENQIVTVHEDDGELFVRCKHGRHYLNGQVALQNNQDDVQSGNILQPDIQEASRYYIGFRFA